MSNAACRMFCGQNNLKGRLPNAARLDRNEPCTFEIARLRLSQCVVGMQEKWNDTLRVLGRWAPWIDTRDACPSGSAGRNEGVRAERIGDLPVALVELLRKHNACDLKLYRYAQERFEA